MPRRKAVECDTNVRISPALSPEDRENRLISMAMDLVEQRLLNGTASSQETTHFLKLGSTKEKLEREMLEHQNELLVAKTEALQSERRIEELYADALKAMREYKGEPSDGDEDV